MNITISVEVLFFAVPFLIAWAFSLGQSDVNTYAWSDRAWYWLLFGPLTLIISLLSWGVYLKWIK